MADKQSRESIETKVSDGVNESSVKVTSEGISLSAIKIDIDVDVSEALTGLKAIQREAKKATQELNSMSAAGFRITSDGGITMSSGNIHSNVFNTSDLDRLILEKMTTKQLAEELAKREGVTKFETEATCESAVISFYGSDGEVARYNVPKSSKISIVSE